MALLKINSLRYSLTRWLPAYETGLFASSRLDSISASLVFICGKKTSAKELGLPEAPKRPLGPYIKFVLEERKKYPDLNFKASLAKLSSTWKSLDSVEKARSSEQFRIEYDLYKKKYEDYKANLSPEQLLQLEKLKQQNKGEISLLQERRKVTEDNKELGKPKHPGNAYSLYMQSISEGNLKGKGNVFKVASDKWKDASEDVKEKFKKEADAKFKAYKKEFKEWQKKVLDLHRYDLLEKPPSKTEVKTIKKH